jgi:flagellar protein FliT
MTGPAADPRQQLKTGKDREKMVVRSEIVHCYEELASSVSLMLELARDKDWGRLPELEARCSAIVDRLKVIEPIGTLEAVEVERVLYLLDRIRAEQTEVSELIKPQLDELISRLGYLSQQKNLGRAYGLTH